VHFCIAALSRLIAMQKRTSRIPFPIRPYSCKRWKSHVVWSDIRMKGRVSIDQRPKSVDTRRFVGDWEGDTFVGKYGLGRIASWVKRKTRYICLAALGGNKAQDLNKAILKRFEESNELPVRTVTLDNGHEFFAHLELCSAWDCQTYFAHPHHPWERGLNENSNGLLRQFFPKRRDFRKVTRKELAEVERLLNTRPRKCLQYRTPEEVMAKLLARIRTD
jgi:IS30 family transposase